tara:strand:+ start:210 stop:509 length:300 start_codon:yes stop_codon:yes gene_type:complete
MLLDMDIQTPAEGEVVLGELGKGIVDAQHTAKRGGRRSRLLKNINRSVDKFTSTIKLMSMLDSDANKPAWQLLLNRVKKLNDGLIAFKDDIQDTKDWIL